MSACLVIPIFDHGSTIRGVVQSLAPYELPCLIVDDGSGPATRSALDAVAAEFSWVRVLRRETNGGKGAALKDGYRSAAERGFSHVIQIDADGQHEASDVARLLELIERSPEAMVLGEPIFDEAVPRRRLFARQISRALVWLATLSFAIRDPLVGLRALPLRSVLAALDASPMGDRMEFEPELAVRLYWSGVPVINLPTRVSYPTDGISHFRLWPDYPRMAATYGRLGLGMLRRAPQLLSKPRQRDATTAPAPDREGDERWASLAESGSILATRLMTHLVGTLGRRVCRVLLKPISLYFLLTYSRLRRVSRDYLEAVHGLPGGAAAVGRRPGWRTTLRHAEAFSLNILDRLVVWGGDFDRFQISHQGSERLFELAREGRGAILLGAHLGSFDVMRVLASRYGLKVNILMYTHFAERINAVFQRLDPESHVRVISLEPGSMRTAFEIKACLDRGELVGILGDRVDPLGREPSARVRFLGREAQFPLSPYLLAGLLGCPVLLSLCVCTGEASYDAVVRPISEGLAVPRREREKHAREMLERYVRELEAACLRTPYQWFNFFDYWEGATASEASP